jgi:glycosyltransferase involved in cell wall biosynthesis
MNPEPRILAIVPCFNEAENIADVVAELRAVARRERLMLDVLVVNDCSTDNSLEIIRKLPCLHLALPVNLGIGGAMQAGYKTLFDMAMTWPCRSMATGSTRPTNCPSCSAHS